VRRGEKRREEARRGEKRREDWEVGGDVSRFRSQGFFALGNSGDQVYGRGQGPGQDAAAMLAHPLIKVSKLAHRPVQARVEIFLGRSLRYNYLPGNCHAEITLTTKR
jgi:hypothetical protein